MAPQVTRGALAGFRQRLTRRVAPGRCRTSRPFPNRAFQATNPASGTGLLAPAGTPAAVLDLLNARVANIMQSSDMKARMTSDGLVRIGGSREQFAAHIRSEIAEWAKVISASGARVD